MTAPDVTTAVERVRVPIPGQSFSSEQDWINRATLALTSHPDYLNTEHGDEKGWRGPHFTALCFDQAGNRMRNGGDFMRATKEGTYPVWWIWPDQIDPILSELDRLSAALGEATKPAAEPLRMDAYYYGFEPTGVGVIDRILSAVASAGKAFHHTDQWTDDTWSSGPSEQDKIQWVANQAAIDLRRAFNNRRPEMAENKHTGPYRAEFGAVYHEDERGFLFTTNPADVADALADSLNELHRLKNARATQPGEV